MATVIAKNQPPEVDYPTGDGKPVGETEFHRDNLLESIQTLRVHFERDPAMYVTGNMFLYYVEGDKRRHVSPDVFVVRGVSKHSRKYYLLWKEGKTPDLVIEFTSESTRDDDLRVKFALYQDVLKVSEYFLFDPNGEHLQPPLQGYRLESGKYIPITAVDSRLPSQVLGLHLDHEDWYMRFFDPATGKFIPTVPEMAADAIRLARERSREVAEQKRIAEEQTRLAEEQTRFAEEQARIADERARSLAAEVQRSSAFQAELERLRRELDQLKGKPSQDQ